MMKRCSCGFLKYLCRFRRRQGRCVDLSRMLVNPFSVAPGFPTVTGGTLTSDATYYYRTFTSNGSLVISDASLAVDLYLVGGGAGGNRGFNQTDYDGNGDPIYYAWGGGGGAAGRYTTVSTTYAPATYSVTIGSGGSGGTADPGAGSAGGTTSIGAYSSTGGNAGSTTNNGRNGGSNAVYSGATATGQFGGAGGAGSGGNGVVNSSNTGGAGGSGVSIGGTTYGVGGSGSNGVFTYSPTATYTGTTNAAAGSGGGGAVNTNAAAGKNGVVVVRYLRSAVGG